MSTRLASRKGQSSRTSSRLRGKVRLSVAVAAAAAGVAAFMITPAADAVARSASAPATATPRWRIAYGSDNGFLYSVTALSRVNAWSVGEGVILHWEGARWKPVKVPGITTSSFLPTTVAASAPNNVWIFGQGAINPGEAHVWNGKAWRTLALPDFFAWGKAAVFGPSDVWDLSAGTTGYCPSVPSQLRTCIFHWNGSAWHERDLVGLAPLDLSSAGGHAWFLTSGVLNRAGAASQLAVYETTSSGLRRISGPRVTLGADIGIAAAPKGQLWLVGRLPTAKQPPVMFHWTGKKWVRIAIPASFYSAVGLPLVFDGKAGVWAGPFAHWTGTRWIHANMGPVLNDGGFTYYDMTAIPGSASAWAVGGSGGGTDSTLIAVYGPLP